MSVYSRLKYFTYIFYFIYYIHFRGMEKLAKAACRQNSAAVLANLGIWKM